MSGHSNSPILRCGASLEASKWTSSIRPAATRHRCTPLSDSVPDPSGRREIDRLSALAPDAHTVCRGCVALLHIGSDAISKFFSIGAGGATDLHCDFTTGIGGCTVKI